MKTIRAMEGRRCLAMTTRDNTREKKRPDYIDKALGQLRGKPLTRRERQVVAAILAGNTTTAHIGAALTIARKTAQTHLCHIYAKTGAASMVELALMALGRIPSAVDFGGMIWR